jgi:NADH-quinone oxidoreductase subunit M
LLGVVGIVLACYYDSNQRDLTFSIPRLVELVHRYIPNESSYVRSVQLWVFLALMAGFAVKVPLVPFHTWLPLAHVEAPTAGSVDLAGVLLKVGAYGFLRLAVPLTPDVSWWLGLPLVSALAVIGVVYGAFCSYSQDDVKKLVAYSSVSHLGLCMLGMFALNPTGLSGSLFQMINHGLSTGALFLLVGMLYERYHTRKISEFGGMSRRLPLLGCLMVFICLSSIGLPGLNGFIGELLVLAGVFERWPAVAVVGSTGIVLGAWYLLTMLRHVFFGPVKEPEHENHTPVGDLDLRELVTVVPIAVLCLLLGVFPQPFIHTAKHDIQIVADIAERARERHAAPAQARAAPGSLAPRQAASTRREPPGREMQPGGVSPPLARVYSPGAEAAIVRKGVSR